MFIIVVVVCFGFRSFWNRETKKKWWISRKRSIVNDITQPNKSKTPRSRQSIDKLIRARCIWSAAVFTAIVLSFSQNEFQYLFFLFIYLIPLCWKPINTHHSNQNGREKSYFGLAFKFGHAINNALKNRWQLARWQQTSKNWYKTAPSTLNSAMMFFFYKAEHLKTASDLWSVYVNW